MPAPPLVFQPGAVDALCGIATLHPSSQGRRQINAHHRIPVAPGRFQERRKERVDGYVDTGGGAAATLTQAFRPSSVTWHVLLFSHLRLLSSAATSLSVCHHVLPICSISPTFTTTSKKKEHLAKHRHRRPSSLAFFNYRRPGNLTPGGSWCIHQGGPFQAHLWKARPRSNCRVKVHSLYRSGCPGPGLFMGRSG